MGTYTVLTSAFNDGATDSPAAARAQYYTNWTAVGSISDVGAANSVLKSTASGGLVLTGGITAGDLAGTGTRVVTADSTGVLGTNTTNWKLPVSGSVSVPDSTATTFATFPAENALYQIFTYVAGYGTGQTHTYGFLATSTNSEMTFTQVGTTSSASISVSGLNLQYTHNIGTTQTVVFSYQRIA
jgi:hypothetical protein